MKLYLSRGIIWTGTQADAKAAQGDNSYEHVEVPVDKPSLLAWLNANWSQPEEPEESAVDLAESDDAADDYVSADKVYDVLHGTEGAAAKRRAERHIHEDMEGHANGYCARCGRTTAGYKMLAAGNTLDSVRDGIFHIDVPGHLDGVVEAVEDRRRELKEKA